MKKINLLILLVISAANAFGAIEINNTTVNSATINLVMAVAASNSQAKPILFFNIEGLNCERDYQTCDLKKASKSDEMNDIEKKFLQNRKEFAKKMNAAENQNEIQYQKIANEHNANDANLSQQKVDLLKKLTAIATSTAKRMGACGVLSYNPNQLLGSCPQMAFASADSDCDITQEVFDTLNTEYHKNKTQIK